jgi:ssDNA-binding Zn-finger/Zn-ribbon topoisomerase 1
LNKDIEWCRRTIREYKALFAALSPDKQARMKELHYIGLSDLVMEEILIMEKKPYWQITCAKCNKQYNATTVEGKCPHCGVGFQIIWPDEVKEQKPKVTIVVRPREDPEG